LNTVCESTWFLPNQISQALSLSPVHFQKIIHRDIKPENILLNANDEIQLADFGVAHIFDGEDWLHNSQGSPAFSPPEVCSGTRFLCLRFAMEQH